MIICGLETMLSVDLFQEHSLIAVYNSTDDNLGFEWPEIEPMFAFTAGP